MLDPVLALGWAPLSLMALAALLVGISKTSFGGIGAVAAALFALAMPAKESTAAVLLLLIVGDVIGVARYGRNVRWKLVVRLVPTIIPGLLLGAVFMRYVNDVAMRRAIGVILLASVGLQVWQRWRRDSSVERPEHTGWFAAGLTGIAAGFTTMTANAAGPVMALYFLAVRLDKKKFIGTNAWFFFLINVSKLPLAASLGLFSPTVLRVDLVLVPFVLVGTLIGVAVIKRVSQQAFEKVTMAASGISAATLLLR